MLIHVDWFQISAKRDTNFHPTKLLTLESKILPYQTRHFAKVEEIFQAGKRVCTIASKPHSPVIEPNVCLVKFDNWYLYCSNFLEEFHHILANLHMKFNNITRLDIACDFNKFDNGLNPENLIKRYLSGQYLKKGRGKFKLIGTNSRVLGMDYLRFGGATSPVSAYLYNKSKELKQAHFKPHIFESWEKNGIDVENDVWRLEFSINSSCKDFLETDTGAIISIRDLELLKEQNISHLFKILCKKYFQFHINEGKEVISRNEVLKLFKGKKSTVKYYSDPTKEESSKSDKVFVKKLAQLNEELRGQDFDLSIGCDSVLNYFVDSRDVRKWAHKKQSVKALPDF